MRTKTIFAVAALALCLAACEKKHGNLKPFTWKNDTAQCCGVSNPTDSLQWLREEVDRYTSINADYRGFECFTCHYVDTMEQSDVVVVYSNSESCYSDSRYYYQYVTIYVMALSLPAALMIIGQLGVTCRWIFRIGKVHFLRPNLVRSAILFLIDYNTSNCCAM